MWGQLDVLKGHLPGRHADRRARPASGTDRTSWSPQWHLRRRACGYSSFAGDMDPRHRHPHRYHQDGTLYVQAAAGVVADLIPEMEWRETEHKARVITARCRTTRRF